LESSKPKAGDAASDAPAAKPDAKIKTESKKKTKEKDKQKDRGKDKEEDRGQKSVRGEEKARKTADTADRKEDGREHRSSRDEGRRGDRSREEERARDDRKRGRSSRSLSRSRSRERHRRQRSPNHERSGPTLLKCIAWVPCDSTQRIAFTAVVVGAFSGYRSEHHKVLGLYHFVYSEGACEASLVKLESTGINRFCCKIGHLL
jgi:splicing factor U2AF subunit